MSNYLTEEEQIEQIKRWWAKHGNWLTTLLVIILLAFSGFRFWQNRTQKIQTQASVRYERMMVDVANGQDQGVSAQAQQIIKSYPDTVYASASGLVLAKQAISKGKPEEALKQLDYVAKQSKLPALRQVAKLRSARILESQKKYKDALAMLATVEDAAYKPLIMEIKGDIYLEQGKKEQAQKIYANVLKDYPKFAQSSPILQMKLDDLLGYKAFKEKMNAISQPQQIV